MLSWSPRVPTEPCQGHDSCGRGVTAQRKLDTNCLYIQEKGGSTCICCRIYHRMCRVNLVDKRGDQWRRWGYYARGKTYMAAPIGVVVIHLRAKLPPIIKVTPPIPTAPLPFAPPVAVIDKSVA